MPTEGKKSSPSQPELIRDRSDCEIKSTETDSHSGLITYGELGGVVARRADRAFEEKRSAEGRNPNRRAKSRFVSAMRNALERFMESNSLTTVDTVGEELVGSGYEPALRRLGNEESFTADVRKSAKAKMNRSIRSWAVEELRSRRSSVEVESFAQTLDRLMSEAAVNSRALARTVSTSARPVGPHAIENWRRGKRSPGPEDSRVTVRLIEKALRVPPDTLFSKVPKVPYHVNAARTGLGRSKDRRVSPYLEGVPEAQREEALAWIRSEVLTAPFEDFDEEGNLNRETYALALPGEDSPRRKRAPERLARQIDTLVRFKTAVHQGEGMVRNLPWGPYTADKNTGDLLRMLGALHDSGGPLEHCTLDLALSPNAMLVYVNWFVERRGSFTNTPLHTLVMLESLLYAKGGLIPQRPDLFQAPPVIPGITKPADRERAKADFGGACAYARAEISSLIKSHEKSGVEQGRDPFAAILPVLDAPQPLNAYYGIVGEIRRRMPDKTYMRRWAAAQRDLLTMRLGIELSFRQRNLREMVVRLADQAPRKASWLRRNRTMEIGFSEDGFLEVRAPREAFKNAPSSVLRHMDADRPLRIEDHDGLYREFCDYLSAREVLLNGTADPGTLFVKNMASRARTPEVSKQVFYENFVDIVRRYGIFNPFNGQGARADGVTCCGSMVRCHLNEMTSASRSKCSRTGRFRG